MVQLREVYKMKTEIFSRAILSKRKVKFYYGIDEQIIEPYIITKEFDGRKVIYGKLLSSHQIKRFEYGKISNIKVLKSNSFAPILPIDLNIN